MIDQYDDRKVLQGTASGKCLLEDAADEDEVDDNLLGLFPNTRRTLFQDENSTRIDELEVVPALFFDTDNQVPHKVPKSSNARNNRGTGQHRDESRDVVDDGDDLHGSETDNEFAVSGHDDVAWTGM